MVTLFSLSQYMVASLSALLKNIGQLCLMVFCLLFSEALVAAETEKTLVETLKEFVTSGSNSYSKKLTNLVETAKKIAAPGSDSKSTNSSSS